VRTRSALHGLVAAGALQFALGAGLASCHSVYRRAEAELPGDMQTRLDDRIKTARGAAQRAISALQENGDAHRAEEADWDLDRAAASIGDVIERLPAPDRRAEEVHAAFVRAEGLLAAAVQSLSGGADARVDAASRDARDALLAAVAAADAYLPADPGR
jgi:hypothetical protein